MPAGSRRSLAKPSRMTAPHAGSGRPFAEELPARRPRRACGRRRAARSASRGSRRFPPGRRRRRRGRGGRARSGSRSRSAGRSPRGAPSSRRGRPSGRRRSGSAARAARAAGWTSSLCTHWPSSGNGSGKEVGRRALVGRRPGLAAVVAAEDAGRGDADVHPLGLVRVELDRVAAHAARARVPALPRRVAQDAVDGCHVAPPSSVRKRTPGAAPSQSRPSSPSRPGSTCQVFSSVSPLSSGARAPRRASTSRRRRPSGGPSRRRPRCSSPRGACRRAGRRRRGRPTSP